jgi:predicted nucleic acid-binding protein
VPLIFDASAVVNLLLARGSKALPRTKNNFALDLTGYEVGNAIWRLCLLEKRIPRSEASELLTAVLDFLNLLQLIVLEELDPNRILDFAISRRLTFYDASYLVAAQTRHLTLVTDDEDLSNAAKEYVGTKRSGQI